MFLSPPVHFARWAHMHHFAFVRLSGLDQKSDWKKIHNSKSIAAGNLKLHHIIEGYIKYLTGQTRQGTNAAT